MNVLEFIKKNILKIVTVPVVISAGSFALLLVQSLSDGVISDEELHSLIQAGSGIELVFLAVIMAVLKVRK